MEFWRSAPNPWGQNVLLGISWSLMWLAVAGGVVFLVGHAIWVRRLNLDDPAEAPDNAGVPEKVLRHGKGARFFHWSMAITMFVLLITAFFPVIGIQFAWVTIHWIAGVALLATVIYHVIHAVFWQDFWTMWVNRDDMAEGKHNLAMIFGRKTQHPDKPGKYPVDQKMYHHAIVLVSTVAIATGLLMMVRVDTPFWARNPYLLSDNTWGFVYVFHGVASVALITLVMAHIYFALRPEKWWMTMSMIKGWVSRKDYLAHHDPDKWKPTAADPSLPGMPGDAGLPEGVTRHDRQAP